MYNVLSVYDRVIHLINKTISRFYTDELNQQIYTIYTAFIYITLAFGLPISLLIEEFLGGVSQLVFILIFLSLIILPYVLHFKRYKSSEIIYKLSFQAKITPLSIFLFLLVALGMPFILWFLVDYFAGQTPKVEVYPNSLF